METTNSNLKPLPLSETKVRLEKMFSGEMASYKFREEINQIIYDNRKDQKGYELLTPKQIKSAKIVLRAEIRSMVQIFGVPFGYYLPENY